MDALISIRRDARIAIVVVTTIIGVIAIDAGADVAVVIAVVAVIVGDRRMRDKRLRIRIKRVTIGAA
jgi:signal transduction histidine kinase